VEVEEVAEWQQCFNYASIRGKTMERRLCHDTTQYDGASTTGKSQRRYGGFTVSVYMFYVIRYQWAEDVQQRRPRQRWRVGTLPQELRQRCEWRRHNAVTVMNK